MTVGEQAGNEQGEAGTEKWRSFGELQRLGKKQLRVFGGPQGCTG